MYEQNLDDVSINPAKHEVLGCLGNALTANGFLISENEEAKIQFNQALDCFEKAVEVCPENEHYLQSLPSCVKDHEWRQAVTAAGSGCISALSVERYLVSNDLVIEFHQPHTEEVKKELTPRNVQEGFDITFTKHKGQVK